MEDGCGKLNINGIKTIKTNIVTERKRYCVDDKRRRKKWTGFGWLV